MTGVGAQHLWQLVLELEQDPTPGDPQAVQTLAARLRREAEYTEQHTNRLHRIVANSGNLRMQGDYAPMFEQTLRQLPEGSARLGPAHEACANALASYAESLEQAKIQAGIALRRGVEADALYRSALEQFYALLRDVVRPESDIWRGLNGETARGLSQYQPPEICEAAVQIGRYAGQAEQERQAARSMALEAERSKREAEAACTQAIRAAAPGETGEGGNDHDDGPCTNGTSGGWSGAGWIERPTDADAVKAAKMYEEIRGTDNKVDLPLISKNTGVSESVLRQVKTHLFRAQHEVAVGPGIFKSGRFSPHTDIAEAWIAARNGPLTDERLREFRHLMAHEYIESQLMKAGVPYVRDHAHLWQLDSNDGRHYRPQFPDDLRDAGAHDLAPHDKVGGFRLWRKLGLKQPNVAMADDLSNADDVVKAVFQELRSNGMDLR